MATRAHARTASVETSHTFGTELAAAGIDLLALRELMGHASPETTAAYVHLSPDALAAEYARVKGAIR
ncbi:MAG: tyrosine-type recombinase/integrase [Actinomycetes bacterium]